MVVADVTDTSIPSDLFSSDPLSGKGFSVSLFPSTLSVAIDSLCSRTTVVESSPVLDSSVAIDVELSFSIGLSFFEFPRTTEGSDPDTFVTVSVVGRVAVDSVEGIEVVSESFDAPCFFLSFFVFFSSPFFSFDPALDFSSVSSRLATGDITWCVYYITSKRKQI